jgi:multisubunit Na+/H+ antiporter MnhB subunit
MSHEHYRRGRNWFSAIGVLFCVMGGIVLIQQLVIWGIDFVEEFLYNSEFTNEKVSVAMIGFGIFMIVLGFRKHEQKG